MNSVNMAPHLNWDDPEAKPKVDASKRRMRLKFQVGGMTSMHACFGRHMLACKHTKRATWPESELHAAI